MDLKSRARHMRNDPTDAERRLWQALRRRRVAGHKFRRQQPLGRFIVDFVCLEQRLIVEVDGAHHIDQVAYDKARDRWLRAQGYRLLRFSDREVLTALDSVEATIWQAIMREVPPP